MKKLAYLIIALPLMCFRVVFADVTAGDLRLASSSESYLKGDSIDLIVFAKNDSPEGQIDTLNFGSYGRARVEVYQLTKDGKKHIGGKDIALSAFTEEVPAGKSMVAYIPNVVEQLTSGTYLAELILSTPGRDPYVTSTTFRVLASMVVQAAKIIS